MNRTLTYLDLHGNTFTDRGADLLARALPLNETLRELLLPGNRLTDRGAITLVASCSTSVQHLNLARNELSEEMITKLLEGSKDRGLRLTLAFPPEAKTVPQPLRPGGKPRPRGNPSNRRRQSPVDWMLENIPTLQAAPTDNSVEANSAVG